MQDYNVGYLDGRNHAIELITKWVQSKKQKLAPDEMLIILQDKNMLAKALFNYDPAFFNNYDMEIGPLE